MNLDAMRQALEALELWEEAIENDHDNEYPIQVFEDRVLIKFIPPERETGGGRMKALQAIERHELGRIHAEAKAALRRALEQIPAPIAWVEPSWLVQETRTWNSESFAPEPIKGWIPLYTTPRQWQGLTDGDIAEIAEKLGLADVAWVDLMQAIERRLKSRNTWLLDN